MIKVSDCTKKSQRIAREAAVYAYAHPAYTYRDIYEAYDRPSVSKVRAWEYCEQLCADLGGFDLVIASRNTFSFTAVFKFFDLETGALSYAYITRDYDRYGYAEEAAPAAAVA